MGFIINSLYLGVHIVYNARRRRKPVRANDVKPIFTDKTVCRRKPMPVLFNREMALQVRLFA